eukprot:1953039-Rhodomonas_salina.1
MQGASLAHSSILSPAYEQELASKQAFPVLPLARSHPNSSCSHLHLSTPPSGAGVHDATQRACLLSRSLVMLQLTLRTRMLLPVSQAHTIEYNECVAKNGANAPLCKEVTALDPAAVSSGPLAPFHADAATLFGALPPYLGETL